MQLKRLISIVLSVIILLSSFAVVGFATGATGEVTHARVVLESDKSVVKVGDTIVVSARLSEADDLVGVSLAMVYDETALEYVSESIKIYNSFAAEEVNDKKPERLKYAGISSKNPPSKGVLFSASFKVLKANAKIKLDIIGACNNKNVDISGSLFSNSVTEIKLSNQITHWVEIKKPSETRIKYKNGIVLHSQLVEDLPDGASLVWSSDNDNFIITPSEDNKTCTIISNKNGKSNISLAIYDEAGQIIEQQTVEMRSDATFIQYIAGFFRILLGLAEIKPE